MPLLGVSTYRELKRCARCLNRNDIAAGHANRPDLYDLPPALGPLAISCLAHLLFCRRDIFCIDAFLANSDLPEA